ncbi:MAG: YncE family protein, partial [Mycobacterium sp.]
VSVIDTATNTVLTGMGFPIPEGSFPQAVAITPDGKHVYVTNSTDTPGTVSVIATASNTVVATVPVGNGPVGVAVTPDGKHAYVANISDGTVSVIDTATNTVLAGPGFPIPVGTGPVAIAVTPDGKHAYVVNDNQIGNGSVSVIDTATNTVLMGTGFPIPVASFSRRVAITPDGKRAYVSSFGSPTGIVSVIDTASNTVLTGPGFPIPVGKQPFGVGIIPPPMTTTVPFLAFNAALEIHFGSKPNADAFALESSFTLSSTAPAINPVSQPVTLQAGTFTTTIPAGSFKKFGGLFTFVGVINGLNLQAVIFPTGTLRYAFLAAAEKASLTGTANPVPVTLTIGQDTGTASVKAVIVPGLATVRLR